VVVTAAFQVIYIPAFVVLGLFFVTQFFTPSSSHVAWEAHAVGMSAGALAALVLARVRPDPDGDRHPLGSTSPAATAAGGSAF
jgi:membrane associated rhomboid family serine protease